MSRYQRGDVVLADISFSDDDGLLTSKRRPMVVIDVEDGTENITVACTTKTHKASRFPGVLVKKGSSECKDMSLDSDTFIYCNIVIPLSNSDIIRRIGNCPLIKEICKKLGYDLTD